MLLIPCPHCGPRDHVEFTYGGDATVRRPADPLPVAQREWDDYVYLRDNPRGRHEELWQHHAGCRAWLRVTRDTLTHEIVAAKPARER
jgi:heterotetrameric sarcosine oxidase delta subunit